MQPIIPAIEPFATFVNGTAALDCSPFMGAAALAQQAVTAFPGDPMVGQTVYGGKIAWVDATEVQKLISIYYTASGLDLSAVGDGIYEKYPGPNALWNRSYTAWGLKAPAAS